MSTIRTLLAAVVLPAILLACTAAPGGPPQLDGRTFLSTKVTDKGADRPLVPGTSIRVTFGKDGQLGVNAGCNHMGGTYRMDGNVLVFDGGAMTEMGCDEARHKQDDWVFGLFGAKPVVAVAGNDLTLTAGDVVIRLLDTEVAEPDLPLVGPLWTVNSIVSGDAVSSIPDGLVATLTFGADGRVSIETGCNSGGGTYQVQGDSIRFGDIVTTKRACVDQAGNDLEAAVLGVLRVEDLNFAIDAGQLSLGVGNQGLILVASGPNAPTLEG